MSLGMEICCASASFFATIIFAILALSGVCPVVFGVLAVVSFVIFFALMPKDKIPDGIPPARNIKCPHCGEEFPEPSNHHSFNCGPM